MSIAKSAGWCSLLLLLAPPIAAQQPATVPDLDVPFVPTNQEVVREMLRLGRVGPNDLVYDLGCGDGRIVITAAKEFGARGVGVDLNPERVAEAKDNAKRAGVEDKVEFRQQDLFETDFSAATVVTMYLLPSVNMRLRPRLLSELKPGTRVVSHAFDMEDWQPDQTATVDGTTVYLWTIPAQVAGEWRWQTGEGRRYQVNLQQAFQQVSGEALVDGRLAELTEAKLEGDRLRLAIKPEGAAEPVVFAARYQDGKLVGVAEGIRPDAAGGTWVAERAGSPPQG